MLNSLVNRFCTRVQNLMMTHLVGDVSPDIDIYDDVAVLTYELPVPMNIEQVMDYMEDDMGIRILYRAMKITDEGQIRDWMDHSTGKSWKLNANDMSELQDMVAETLQMERGTSKTETNLEHLERNDYIIHKQENKKKLLEEEQKKALAEKKAAEAQVAKIKEQVAKAESEKESAEQEKKKAVADKEDAECECAKAVAKKENVDNEYQSLDTKYNGLIAKYNTLVDRHNNTLHNMQHWRNAEGWQIYLLDYFSDLMYKSDQVIKYAVDSLISFANNNYGSGGHQDILHDNQSASVKMVLERFSPSDKSVWQKVAAWLLGLSKRFGQLSVDAVIRASRELDDVVNGKYDWRIERFMRNNGWSR